MDIQVDNVDVQEYHEFARPFLRAEFDGDRLAHFLNERSECNDSKWKVESSKKDADEKVGRQRVTIENLKLVASSWLFTQKIVIDEDSVLWLAKGAACTITERDEVAQKWPELIKCFEWLKEFYELDDDYFELASNRYRDIYLTRTDGVRLACSMEQLLHPELWKAMKDSTTAAYDERGLFVVLHPFGIQTKVNYSPKPETMRELSQGQIKAAIGRDDLEIGVRRFEDYADRYITLGSQMPFHSHVRTLRSIVQTAAKIAESGT